MTATAFLAWRSLAATTVGAFAAVVASGGHPASAAGPVHVIHPPVPVIIPHPVPPPVHVVVPPAPPVHVVIPPPVPPPVHVVVPPPPPVHVTVAPVPHPPPVAQIAAPPAPATPVDRIIAPPAAPARPSTRGQPIVHPSALPEPRPTAARTRLPPPPPTRPAPPPAAAIRTATADRSEALPPPPPVRPVPPRSATAPDGAAAAGAPAATAGPSAPVLADPPAPKLPAQAVGTAVTPMATETASVLATSGLQHEGLVPQPSGRLPLQPGLLDALTAPFTLIPDRPVVAAPPPRVTVAASGAASAPSASPPAIGTTVPATGATLASRQGQPMPKRRLFDSPMRYLTSHLIPVVRSPFSPPGRMRGAAELWAQHAWPFGRSLAQRIFGDNSAAIAAVIAGALTAMTGLTVAGAALSGQPLKHMAWRSGRVRYRPGLPWDMADMSAEGGPRQLPAARADQIAAWPGTAGVRSPTEPEPAARRRRVA